MQFRAFHGERLYTQTTTKRKTVTLCRERLKSSNLKYIQAPNGCTFSKEVDRVN